MGSSKEPIFEEIKIPELEIGEKLQLIREELMRSLPAMLQLLPDDNPTDTMKLYRSLGELRYDFSLFCTFTHTQP